MSIVITYSYPTSPRANKLGYGRTGCYNVVNVLTHQHQSFGGYPAAQQFAASQAGKSGVPVILGHGAAVTPETAEDVMAADKILNKI
jgi:hypothetical protein